jgi:putative Ca2+/H+ antiporter (TMEM165/GDT1 family)
MMLVNVPAVLCGNGIARRLPLKPIRIAAAALFAILGALTLLRWDFGLLGA